MKPSGSRAEPEDRPEQERRPAVMSYGGRMGAMERTALSGWERVALAVEQVRERLRRAVAALEGAKVPYAVIGGNAVAEWVGRVDQAAVRNTQDVDILLRRAEIGARGLDDDRGSSEG